MNTKEIVPEIPPEVQNRMARGTALTQNAADELGTDEISVSVAEGGIGEAAAAAARNSGPTRVRLRYQQEQIDARQVDAINELAKAPPGFEPAAGMPASEVMKIMGKNYPEGPAQDPFFGDRTPAFICWMFENHPVEAHIRYLSRLMPDAGRWIAKNHPGFKYTAGKRVALEALSVHGSTEFDPSVKPPAPDSPEVTALRARIAQLEAQTPKPKKTRGKAKAKPAKANPASQPTS